ncbi:MAG: hypothetical protein ACRDFS_09770, partial [Chloroflexota bacterium]
DSYNQTKPAGLAAQGSACKTAAAALPSHTFRVSDAPPNLASQVRALRHAYQSARKGFQLCSSAAVQLNYPRMVAANSAIRNADHWVHTAKRL